MSLITGETQCPFCRNTVRYYLMCLPALRREAPMWCRPGAPAAKGWCEGCTMCARVYCVKISAIAPKSTDLFITDIAKRGESGYNSIGVA